MLNAQIYLQNSPSTMISRLRDINDPLLELVILIYFLIKKLFTSQSIKMRTDLNNKIIVQGYVCNCVLSYKKLITDLFDNGLPLFFLSNLIIFVRFVWFFQLLKKIQCLLFFQLFNLSRLIKALEHYLRS